MRVAPRLLSVVLVILWLARPGDASSDDSVTTAKELLGSAREAGLRWLSSEDKKAKSVAKKDLAAAEKLLQKDLKRDKSCQECGEQLVAVSFYETYFKLARDYDECLERADKMQERFPESAVIAFYRGYAQANAGRHEDASRSFQRYLTSGGGDPATDAQVREMLKASQASFLGGWNNQQGFYQSREAQLVWFNAQAQRNELYFQATPEVEMQLGAQAFQGLTAQAKRVDDPELQSYLDDMVKRLVEKSPGNQFQYQVTVIDSPEVNAVTPPGHIIVFTGLLAFVESEAELAGVLSHELAHNYAHHVSRRIIKAAQAQMVAQSVAQAINPQNLWAQLATQLGTGFAVNLVVNAYSRFEEKEADLYGSHIAFNAGYDPTALSAFFLKLYQHNPKAPPKFLSTHPPSADRADYLTDYLEAFPLDREMTSSSEAFEKLRARYGRSAANGPVGLPPVLR